MTTRFAKLRNKLSLLIVLLSARGLCTGKQGSKEYLAELKTLRMQLDDFYNDACAWLYAENTDYQVDEGMAMALLQRGTALMLKAHAYSPGTMPHDVVVRLATEIDALLAPPKRSVAEILSSLNTNDVLRLPQNAGLKAKVNLFGTPDYQALLQQLPEGLLLDTKRKLMSAPLMAQLGQGVQEAQNVAGDAYRKVQEFLSAQVAALSEKPDDTRYYVTAFQPKGPVQAVVPVVATGLAQAWEAMATMTVPFGAELPQGELAELTGFTKLDAEGLVGRISVYHPGWMATNTEDERWGFSVMTDSHQRHQAQNIAKSCGLAGAIPFRGTCAPAAPTGYWVNLVERIPEGWRHLREPNRFGSLAEASQYVRMLLGMDPVKQKYSLVQGLLTFSDEGFLQFSVVSSTELPRSRGIRLTINSDAKQAREFPQREGVSCQ